jgi:hypothetical protein
VMGYCLFFDFGMINHAIDIEFSVNV